MSSSNILNFSKLLTPINSKFPVGEDLRKTDSNLLYQNIKDARTAARNIERQQIQGVEKNQKANWKVVTELSSEALTSHTKDLEICAWLIESLIRQYEFAGLAEGFRLTRELVECYGKTLYPLPDEEGISTQVAPLTGLNGEESDGTLIAPISMIPLTEGKNAGPFSLWQYQQALEILKIADTDKRTQRIAKGAITVETIAIAISETSPEFLKARLRDLQNSIEEFQQLNYLLEQCYGQHTPPSSRILSRLETCVEFLTMLAKEKMGEPLFAQEISSISDIQASYSDNEIKEFSTEKTFNCFTTNNIDDKFSASQQRNNILQSIVNAAEFFRHTEPHSPIPYLLDKSVRWGRMTFPDLLQEIVQDEKTRGIIFNVTGIGK